MGCALGYGDIDLVRVLYRRYPSLSAYKSYDIKELKQMRGVLTFDTHIIICKESNVFEASKNSSFSFTTLCNISLACAALSHTEAIPVKKSEANSDAIQP